jgi:cytochrome c peroxidase
MLALSCGTLPPALAFGASLQIDIAPKFSGDVIQPDSLRYQTSAREPFSITRISYLLSGFALQRSDGSWFELTNQIAWMDAERGRSSLRVGNIPAEAYRSLLFQIGLDEKDNHADIAKLPAEHPLNPNLNGLHWSWQGGYIFLALEGMWRNSAGALDGWSYHFARDTNRTRINLAVALDLTRDTKVELDFDLATLLRVPRPLSFAKDGSSTHSRDSDPIAAALAANLPGAFHVSRVGAVSPDVNLLAQRKPLYLPARFTPFRFQISSTFPIPDLPRDNPLIEERVALGEKLFHEPALSKDGTISCASCHKANAAFTDPRKFSVGVREQVGTRNAMPLLNLAWKNSFFWDGRAPSLRAQALMPIQDHREMDESLTNVVDKLARGTTDRDGLPLTFGEKEDFRPPAEKPESGISSKGVQQSASIRQPSPLPGREGQSEGKEAKQTHRTSPAQTDYATLFTAAFGSPEITPEKIGLAIESFVLTLTSFNSKFDRALRGEEKLSTTEQRGFELFMTEYDPRREQFGADCFHCHGGPLFQSQTFANNGLDEVFKDIGRAKITGKDADKGKFATPSLRNIALTAPYMHDGRFATLEEVVDHYSTGMKRSATLDPNLAKHPDGGVPLSARDKAALVVFMKTLTDEQFAGSSTAVR